MNFNMTRIKKPQYIPSQSSFKNDEFTAEWLWSMWHQKQNNNNQKRCVERPYDKTIKMNTK